MLFVPRNMETSLVAWVSVSCRQWLRTVVLLLLALDQICLACSTEHPERGAVHYSGVEVGIIDWQEDVAADPMMALSTPSMSSWPEESGRLVELG